MPASDWRRSNSSFRARASATQPAALAPMPLPARRSPLNANPEPRFSQLDAHGPGNPLYGIFLLFQFAALVTFHFRSLILQGPPAAGVPAHLCNGAVSQRGHDRRGAEMEERIPYKYGFPEP